MWPIEARCAAIANNYFTVAINRIGTVSYVSLLCFCNTLYSFFFYSEWHELQMVHSECLETF